MTASTNTMNKEVTRRTAQTQVSPVQSQPTDVEVRQPQFASEIKRIREQLQNHYEVQIKGLLEEIHAQKKCIEMSYLAKFQQ